MNTQNKIAEHQPEKVLNQMTPRVSIGMPVYNGEKFLAEALDSLLAQQQGDFELIISDNGSTDSTEEICRNYAAADSRIQYYRSSTNHGATWNFNRVFELSKGEFFMWASHDDLWAPDFLSRCMEVLDQNPQAVLCYSSTKAIDDNGNVIKVTPPNAELASMKVYKRFNNAWRYPPQILVFGLMRSDTLKKTRLIGNYSSSDRTLAGELALLGPLYGISDKLFFYRKHQQQSTGVEYPTRHSRVAWYDPSKAKVISFPYWRLFAEYVISISRTPLNLGERVLCYASLARWMLRYWPQLLGNLILKERIVFRNRDSRKNAAIRIANQEDQ